MVALHCTIDLLLAWTGGTECGARAKDSHQRGGWTCELLVVRSGCPTQIDPYPGDQGRGEMSYRGTK